MQETKNTLPNEIERQSFAIISELLGDRTLDPVQAPVIKRVIHTTADFDYIENLVFSNQAIEQGISALRRGATVVTDTEMVRAGINKRRLGVLGGEAICQIADPAVAANAEAANSTRAAAAVDQAISLAGPLIFAIGNAPTALLRLCELIEAGKIAPALVIGTPVGFVNVLEAKAQLMQQKKIPFIVACGRKGGSNVAAAIVNALIYQTDSI